MYSWYRLCIYQSSTWSVAMFKMRFNLRSSTNELFCNDNIFVNILTYTKQFSQMTKTLPGHMSIHMYVCVYIVQ